MLTYGASPMAKDVPPEWQGKVVHAALNIDGRVITGADNPPSQYQTPQGFSLTIEAKDAAEAERIFAAFAANAKVQMPLQKTFWATRFGMLVDRLGIPWMIHCGKASRWAASSP